MGKLHFKFGAMGSSKTAQALIKKYNYEERGHNVLFLKPAVDTRDGKLTVKSRIGLEAEAIAVGQYDSIKEIYDNTLADVIIADESQFFSAAQIEELRKIVDMDDIPVFCYGLKTDFQSNLFKGSMRLFELADSLEEIPMVCRCGKNALINARYDESGSVVGDGDLIVLGGNDKYLAMCYSCWKKALAKNKEASNEKISKE